MGVVTYVTQETEGSQRPAVELPELPLQVSATSQAPADGRHS